jgi:lipoprotein-releasing system ATP-binding protein
VLEIQNVYKEYPTPGARLQVLANIDISVNAGEAVSIVGPSGSGKSSLLYVIGGIEPPSKGTVLLQGQDLYALDERRLALFRNEKIGFVFQDSHLLPQCTVLENVLIPTLVAPPNNYQTRAFDLLNHVGLKPRIYHRPHELSGGEKQRVALARALILNPVLVLCDEPTGNLDRDSTETVASLLMELHRDQKNMLIVVTHNLDLAARLGRQYRLMDTQLQPVSPQDQTR